MATLIHPTAKVLLGTKISPGCVIEHYSVISCDSIIDENVLVLPFVAMGNNCEIGKHSVVSTHSNICASVVIGDGTYFGVNCCVRENTTIGDNVIVSAGSVVLKDIGSDVIAQGNPARAILPNKTGDIYKREKSMK